MKSLFDSGTYHDVLQRIEQLDEQKQALWGKMNVVQMLNHCQRPLNVANGRMTIAASPNPLVRLAMRWYKPKLYNDTPWEHGLPTIKDFKVESHGAFVEEKEKLKECLGEFNKKALNLHWPKHPLFGEFTTEQWGKMQYKHIDHHLRQFKV